MNKRARGIGGFLSGALLNLAAIGGLICLVLVALAFVFNATLIMFKAGSMGPTVGKSAVNWGAGEPETAVQEGRGAEPGRDSRHAGLALPDPKPLGCLRHGAPVRPGRRRSGSVPEESCRGGFEWRGPFLRCINLTALPSEVDP